FWPLSRQDRPKQLLSIAGDRSLLVQTVERLAPKVSPDNIWVVTTRRLVEQIRSALPSVPVDQILAEPEGRNTAAAIGWSIRCMPRALREGVIAVLPSDHRVRDEATFRRVLGIAARAAQTQDRIITLGVKPRWAETGYGYLEVGSILDSQTDLRQVVRFCEKPDSKTAEEFVAAGNFLWNAGMFVFRGSSLLAALDRFEPELADGLRRIEERPELLEDLYRQLPAKSIDYAVMERLGSLATLPLDCGWSDLGSWPALMEELGLNEQGSVEVGNVVALDSTDNLLYADQGTIAVLGVEGLVVVRTNDAVLVVPVDRAQQVRRLIAELERRGLEHLL
ncbi:MAG: sugar phosphate nucleotidyltransferase, partial [Thermoanaerobaculia bacterium]